MIKDRGGGKYPPAPGKQQNLPKARKYENKQLEHETGFAKLNNTFDINRASLRKQHDLPVVRMF